MPLDASGLTVQSIEEILAESQTAVRLAVGDQMQLGSDSLVGVLLNNGAIREGATNQLLLAIYKDYDPHAATGQGLDNIAAYTLITRKAATATVVSLELTGTPATVVPAGSIARVSGGVQFTTDADATIGGGGTIEVTATATVTGPLQALAGTITLIVSPVVGWASVTNLLDATEGTDTENDEELRARRADSLQAAGSATDQAIRDHVLKLNFVTSARVISNRFWNADIHGTPGKSFVTVVWPAVGGNAQAVWNAIYEKMPAGIFSFGSTVGTATDSNGIEQPVAFSEATTKDIHVLVEISGDLPGTVVADIKTLLSAVVFDIGEEVAAYKLQCAITDPTSGITGITALEVFIREGAAPTATLTYKANITTLQTEIAVIESTNVDVTVI